MFKQDCISAQTYHENLVGKKIMMHHNGLNYVNLKIWGCETGLDLQHCRYKTIWERCVPWTKKGQENKGEKCWISQIIFSSQHGAELKMVLSPCSTLGSGHRAASGVFTGSSSSSSTRHTSKTRLDATVQLERLILPKGTKPSELICFFKTACGKRGVQKKEVVGGGDRSDAWSSKRS